MWTSNTILEQGSHQEYHRKFLFFSHLSPNNRTTLSDISKFRKTGNSKRSFLDTCCSYLRQQSLPPRINNRPLLRLKIHLQFFRSSTMLRPDDLCSPDILYCDLNKRRSLLITHVLSSNESPSHMRIFCLKAEVFGGPVTASKANECICTRSLFGRNFC